MSPAPPSNRLGNFEENLLLSSLRSLVAGGEHRLDPMLASIADAARRLSGASGAAIAMWKDGAMVCRARSGAPAPALGAVLNVDSGISGECLRTGQPQHCADTDTNPFVDAEVCRTLGLRSLAVLPIQGWRGINGILEVFSKDPGTFADRHLALLEQVAALAERARASQPHGASPVVPLPPMEQPKPSGILPASDPVGDVAFALLGGRRLIVGVVSLAAILLIAFVIWLGWRGPAENGRKLGGAQMVVNAASKPAPVGHVPDSDPVWKPNPLGQVVSPVGGKVSAGTPVQLASELEVVVGTKKVSDQSLLAHDAANLALPHQASLPASNTELKPHESGEASIEQPPAITTGESDTIALASVLAAKASLPSLSAPVSAGVSGGRLLHRVTPVYPSQAKVQRVEGRVVLNALIKQDGRVGDVTVVEGPTVLARSALDAVKQWRYQPYSLDGKTIQREATITIDFKLP